jgi:curved DNA-binding protein
MEYKDYYKILGVERNADEKEIKKAYRRLARQFHPDMKPGDKAAEARFKEINEANEVLSDPEKRRKYDELGQNYQRWQQSGGAPGGFDWSQWAANQPRGGQGRGGQPGGPRVEYANVEDLFGGSGGFSDFFEAIFGGMAQQQAGGSRTRWASGAAPSQAAPPRDIEQEVEVTLEEAFQGTQRLMELDGRRLEIKIPAGVKTGSRVRMAGEALPAGRGGTAGDIYLVIKVLPHPVFHREGDNLHCEVPVDMFTALLGGELRVPTLAGPVALRIPTATQSGRTFRLKGQGMPRLKSGERGDLLAKVRIMLPENLSDREQQLAREWAQLRGVAVPGEKAA